MASKSLEKWRNRGKTFSYRGHDIFYRQQGKGELLVLIHGYPTASFDWSLIWPELAKRFRLLAPDLLGFGFSDKPSGHPYRCTEQAGLIEALIDRIGAKRFHILCHDYGVSVAQELLARYKARRIDGDEAAPHILSVCFLNGGLFPETHRPRPIQRLLLSPLGPLAARFIGYQSFKRAMCRIFSPDHQPSEETLSDFWTLVRHNRGRRVVHKLLHYIPERRINRSRWVGAMVQTAIPVRLINGALDPVSGNHVAERYRELIPKADIISLEQTGHYPQIEAPDQVLRAYLDFARQFLDN